MAPGGIPPVAETGRFMFRRALWRAVVQKRRDGVLDKPCARQMQRAILFRSHELETAVVMAMEGTPGWPEMLGVEWVGGDMPRAQIVGDLQGLLEWILANWEQIAKIIMFIIGLFVL